MWEICAGRPLGAEMPGRLHDIVDDMPADVDDLVMGALRAARLPRPRRSCSTICLASARATPSLCRGCGTVSVLGGAPALPGGPHRRLGDRRRAAPRLHARVDERARAVVQEGRHDGGRPPKPPAQGCPIPVHEGAGFDAVQTGDSAGVEAGDSAGVEAGEQDVRHAAVDEGRRAVWPARLCWRSPSVHPGASGPPSPSLLLIHAGEEGQSLAGALRAAGYPVVVHRDAASGLAFAIAENPVCVLCDSDLPDGDGEAVVRRIRQQPSAVADAPFVLLATRGDTQAARRAASAPGRTSAC